MKRSVYLSLVLTLVVLVASGVAKANTTAKRIKHDRDVIRFFLRHPRLAHTPAGQRELWKIMSHVVTVLGTRQTQSARVQQYPPHHRLWECIQRYEGAWNNHGPGHYGGLQMTWGWLGYINGDAGNYSQAQQEWAAEKAWAANGYSYSFLVGQWYAYDAADGCGTTG